MQLTVWLVQFWIIAHPCLCSKIDSLGHCIFCAPFLYVWEYFFKITDQIKVTKISKPLRAKTFSLKNTPKKQENICLTPTNHKNGFHDKPRLLFWFSKWFPAQDKIIFSRKQTETNHAFFAASGPLLVCSFSPLWQRSRKHSKFFVCITNWLNHRSFFQQSIFAVASVFLSNWSLLIVIFLWNRFPLVIDFWNWNSIFCPWSTFNSFDFLCHMPTW